MVKENKLELTDREDIRSGNEPARGRSNEVSIAGADLMFRSVVFSDPVPTGRQVIQAFAGDDPAKFIALQWLANGVLEELRLDEKVDLRAPGVERFIVVRSDRIFVFEINGKRKEWAISVVTGATLKKLARADPTDVDLFLERHSQPDREIYDNETVDLAAPGIERFYVKRREHEIELIINNKPVLIEKGERTGREIKEAGIAAGLPIKADFLLSLDGPDSHSQSIGDTDRVKVRTRQRFTAVADDDNS